MRIMQVVVFLWLLVFFFALSFAPACDGDQKNDEQLLTTCNYQGICAISYGIDNKGNLSSHRICTLGSMSDKSCGDCWDFVFGTDKKLTKKTCLVCKLCRDDFECLQGDDCPKTAPFCQGGTCVACRSTADCDKEKRFCKDGQCVTCRTDSDFLAEATPQCEDGICVACKCGTSNPQKPYCYKDLKDRSVDCVSCSKNSHCESPTPKCDIKKHLCVAWCKTNIDCKPKEFCQDGLCLSCRKHSDCQDPKKPI